MQPYAAAGDERYRARVRAWAEERLRDLDDDQAGDDDARGLVRDLGRSGLLRAVLPGREGKLRSLPLAAAREELARLSPLCDALYAMQGLGSHPVTLAGSAGLRRRWLPEVAAGTCLAAFAITEAEAGSDVASLATRARKDGHGYVLEGEKRFISNAGIAGLYTVFARTGEPGSRGVSAFAVPADAPGLSVPERTPLIAPHPLGVLRLDGCRVPASARLGAEGEGLRVALRTLDVFRPTVGAAACGMAARALAEAVARVKARRQFGQPLAAFQAVRFRIAAMATRLEAARGLVFRAAWLHDRGERATAAAAMAKLAATEGAFAVVDDALQLHGGEGLVRGRPVERLYREVRALRIYEGTSEIQHLVIARELLGA